MKTTERTKLRREAHHKALEELALRVGCKTPGLKLWRKLVCVERQIYKVCEHYTNGTDGIGTVEWEIAKGKTIQILENVFGGEIPEGIFINGDPRGHMLKLDCEFPIPDGMERDWGGDGILAAEIEEEA